MEVFYLTHRSHLLLLHLMYLWNGSNHTNSGISFINLTLDPYPLRASPPSCVPFTMQKIGQTYETHIHIMLHCPYNALSDPRIHVTSDERDKPSFPFEFGTCCELCNCTRNQEGLIAVNCSSRGLDFIPPLPDNTYSL